MLGPLIVSPRSGQDAFGWCRRVRRLPGLGRTHGGCGDYFEVEENGRIVARICYEPGVVKWCSTIPASGEPDCAFKDGLTLEVLDADGSLLGVETTFHTEWDGGGLALADFSSPIIKTPPGFPGGFAVSGGLSVGALFCV